MRPLIGILCGFDGDGTPRDSIPHNYGAAIEAAGGAPVLLPCSAEAEATEAALAVVQGLIITGGVDVDPARFGESPRRQLGAISPERDLLDERVMALVLDRSELPVLGICRGIQAMNVFAGGTLIQDIPSQVEGAIKHAQQAPGWFGTHEITISEGSILADTVGAEPLVVNSFHHQAVREIAPGFRAVAHAQDGVVEAIERVGARYCLGVQFHPEHMVGKSERLARLFARLVEEAGKVGFR